MSDEPQAPKPETESATPASPESQPESPATPTPPAAAPVATPATPKTTESAPPESAPTPSAGAKPESDKPDKSEKSETKPEASAKSEKSEKSEPDASDKPDKPASPLDSPPPAPVQRKRGKRHVPEAIVHVTATFNNTIVTFADREGKVIAWATTGSSGFKGARKGTPYAAQIAAENAARKAQEHGVESVEIRVRGVGSGRDSAVRAINALGIRIAVIRDVTPVPHNGCRPPKRRRV